MMDCRHTGTRMDSKLLIDAIVRQTTVLIASLSTASGIRAPLAHVADQVFLDLAREIESQGVGRKVVADMFGLALRTYQRKVQRLSESITEHEQVNRNRVAERFRRDLPEDVAAVLNDLVMNGLVFVTGHGKTAVYRAVPPANEPTGGDARDIDALDNLVWAAVYRHQANTCEALSQTLGAPPDDIDRAVARLVEDGRIKRDGGSGTNADTDGTGKLPELTARTLLLPVGAEQGWEAAVFDHFSTVASAIASKVNRGPGSQQDDVVGGATLCFEICRGHSYEDRVCGLLKRVRSELNELWHQVESHNRAHPLREQDKVRVHFYFGQNAELQDEPLSERQEKQS